MPPNIERRLPPSQIDCKWWMRGYCARGKTCHFKHSDGMFSAHNRQDQANIRNTAETFSNLTASTSTLVEYEVIPESASATAAPQTCAICLETPDTYGLLINCDHAFCLECIRNWRATAPANPTMKNKLNKTSKTCPICRSQSDFIIPSSIWPIVSAPASASLPDNTMKKGIVDGYLGRLKTIPCRYFEQSIKDSSPDYKFKCQFGNNCHYLHTHPTTKEPYTFSEEELRPRRRPPRRAGAQFLQEMAILEMLFSDSAAEQGNDAGWLDEDDDDDEDDFGDELLFEREFLMFSDLDFDGLGMHYDYDYGWD